MVEMTKKTLHIDADKHPLARDINISYKGQDLRNVTKVTITMVDFREHKDFTDEELALWKLARKEEE
jgi:hypothetical protein